MEYKFPELTPPSPNRYNENTAATPGILGRLQIAAIIWKLQRFQISNPLE